MGQGGSMILAQEAAHLFPTALPPTFFPVVDSHIQAMLTAQLTRRDVVLYFSLFRLHQGAAGQSEDRARERGAGVILITRFPQVARRGLRRCGAPVRLP